MNAYHSKMCIAYATRIKRIPPNESEPTMFRRAYTTPHHTIPSQNSSRTEQRFVVVAMYTQNLNRNPTYKFAICVSVSIWMARRTSARIFGTLTQTKSVCGVMLHCIRCPYKLQLLSFSNQSHFLVVVCMRLASGKLYNEAAHRKRKQNFCKGFKKKE